ncbi:efflux RND transporter periplasmic adaptor subunit [Niveibacterium terrae]|uniref:efflux RND transporter periplasmic adaptor subunit n=1 Tax=Niveibacterium terrae TaxID=3373598 RepID=UPI003A8FD03A
MNAVADSPLLVLLELGHRARAAEDVEELAFLLVNDTHLLWPYRQAALWFDGSGVRALSGVVQPERNVPYVQWLDRVFRHLCRASLPAGPCGAQDLPADLADEWQDWLPAHALWLPLPARADCPEFPPGGLLLAGEEACDEQTRVLLGEWLATWSHAWRARFKSPVFSLHLLRQRLAKWRDGQNKREWWKRRHLQLALGVFLLLFFPVRLTVLAQGELVPARPAMIRAPLDGVIGKFAVSPNEKVKSGQLLFSFDEAPITTRLEVARQTLATAETEYRQFAQMALVDGKSKEQLAGLLGKIGEKRSELEFLSSQFQRSQVTAPEDGIVIFDDPSEWIGRPVQTGERVMKLAKPDDVEIEAWVPIADAIPLAEGSPVSLYLAASPFSSVSGRLRYLNHDATPRPDGSYAYRARATLAKNTENRIGLKGTAKLSGDWVPLVYWLVRRPLAVIRQYLAV